MPSKISSDNAPSPVKPLSAFTRLSPAVRIYDPPQSSTPPSPLSPTTIVLCSWMNAAPKHIDYYARTYMRLFPSARIILTTINTVEFMFHSETKRRSDIKAAVTALLSRGHSEERILIHGLSNGGCKRVYGIVGAYRAATGKRLPAKAFITDSAMGIPRFRRDIHALGHPARNFSWLLWAPYMFGIYLVVSVVYVSVNWMPKWWWRELVWGPIDGLNDVSLVDNSCVKGYVYSKEDLAIDWEDVEKHARAAEDNGYKVISKRVGGAEHVQMFRGKGGEKDYWGFIEKVWRTGLGLGEENIRTH